MAPKLFLQNTLNRRREEFVPLEPGKVKIYNCGPTVYSDPHIGNFRSFLMADLVRRYLDAQGYEVTQVMNITDVGHLTVDDLADAEGEDKLVKRAREQGRDPWELARHYEEVFFDNLDRLHLRRAHHYPRATDHIPEMIEMIERLVSGGHAYVVEGVGVYFRVGTFTEYGRLSGNTVEELDAGARIEVDERKESPQDFALWKIDPKHLMQWDSPWGRGYPGWHIECSAMSRKFLGDSFDIHTGGEDNIFPHHECERAQSLCATSGEFARYWLHARFLLVDGAKMAKSAGNFLTVNDLLAQGYDGAEIRYALIHTHYGQQANFTQESLEASRKALERLRNFRSDTEGAAEAGEEGEAREEVRRELTEGESEFAEALSDDLNISKALGVLHTRIRALNRERPNRAEAGEILAWLRRIDEYLGLIFTDEEGIGGLSAEEQGLLDQREEARRNRDFARADELRDALARLGVVIKDTPAGPQWVRK